MNTPNKLTILRIVIVPFLMFFYLATFIPFGKLIALVLLIVAEFTDFLDGFIARKNNLISNFGKLMDPIADKSITLTAMTLLAIDNVIVSPFGAIVIVITLLRDFLVGGLRQVSASKQIVIQADKWGKLKSFVLDISLPLFFLVAFLKKDLLLAGNLVVLNIFAYATLLIAIILTIFSGINYIVKNKKVFEWM